MPAPHRPIRTADAAASYLAGLINVERRRRNPPRRFGLERIEQLLERLGQPQRGLSVVHVAGSKGKGSTALLLEAILRAAGERVGTFTSPHLERWTERFRIDGREVDGAALADAVETLRPHVDALRAAGAGASFFDATTAAGFLLFRAAGVDRVVLEVGLGGRLDSTNVVDPAVACITSIELEHTELLGATPAAIAAEKAGIVKAGRPVVMGALEPEAAAVVAARAAECGAPLSRLGVDFEVKTRREDEGGLALRLRDGPLELETTLPVLGAHQAQNAALALACARRLGAYADAALAAAAREGLSMASLPGRIEVLGRRPWRIVDCAHTAASARELARVLGWLPGGRVRLVLSVSSGKNLPAILAALLPRASEVYVTRAEPIRSLAPPEVAAAVRAASPALAVHAVPNPHLAVRAALRELRPDDVVCIAGSMYLAGVARRILCGAPDAGAPARDWFGRTRGPAGAGRGSAP